MTRALLVAVTAVLLATSAHAAPPKPGPADPRIKVVDYDPWAVVRVTGVFRTATQILLAEDETILHVALGDSDGWEVAAETNILFVKPKAQRPPTNLILSATSPAGVRHYAFELVTRTGPATRATADTVFALRFRYPAAERQAAGAVLADQAAKLERQLLTLKLDRAVVEGRRNLAYSVQGARDLQPSEVSDNGRFTVLKFPGGQAMPTVFEVDAKGDERLVPFDVRGEFVVVHGVARQLRLRRGDQALCIFNDAYDPRGPSNLTGTAAKDVRRQDIGAPGDGH